MSRRPAGLALVLAVLGLATTACGRQEGSVESLIIGDTVTVYSSVPLSGELASVGRDLVAAEKLAIREAGGRAGMYHVSYVSLDARRSTRGAIAANARQAVQTPNTVAYLGEYVPGASATSVPILNAAGMLQITPRDTFAPLTEPAGRDFYPAGFVSFARMVPSAEAEVEPLVRALREDRVRRVRVAHDGRRAGTDLAARIVEAAEREGIEVAEDAAVLVWTGGPGEAFDAALRDRAPRARVYAADPLAVDPELPGHVRLVDVDPGTDAAFTRRFAAAYGRPPHPQALLGYRAMRVVLEAVRRAGDRANSRREVIRQAQALLRDPPATFSGPAVGK